MNIIKRILGVLLIIGLLFSSYNPTKIEAAEITDVTVGGIDLEKIISGNGTGQYIIEAGEVVKPTVPIYVDDTIRLTLYWSLTPEQLLGVEAGDYFNIALPTNHFRFENTGLVDITAPIDSQNPNLGTEVIGQWRVIDGNAQIVLNEIGSKKAYISNGRLSIIGKPGAMEDDFEIVVGGVTYPNLTIEAQNNYWEAKGNQILTKSGSKVGGSEAIHWDLWLNEANTKKVFEGGEPEQMNSMILTDDLEEGQTVQELKIFTAFRNMTQDGKMATKTWRWLDIKSQFKGITANIDETYESFYDRVVAETIPSYGVFNNRKVIVNLTNIPGAELKLFEDDAALSLMIDSAVNSGLLPASQKDAIFDIYKTNGNMQGKPMEFLVKVIATPLDGNKEYTNTAKVTYNNNLVEEVAANFYYQSLSGTAEVGEAGDLVLRKKDGDSNQVLQGVKFKVQYFDTETNQFVDYTDDEGQLVKTTDNKGEIVFGKFKKGLYQVVEVENPLAGYSDQVVYTDGNQFEITGYETAATYIEALNYLERGAVELVKTDSETGILLAGAVFELQKEDGTVISTNHRTDIDGEIAITDLLPGKYQLIETEAPVGYEIDVTPVMFTIELGQQAVVEVTKTNTIIKSAVELLKTDSESGVPLTGAVFELHKEDGTVISSNHTTNASGKVTITDLVPGNYQLVEITAPTGYELDATPVPFTIELGQHAIVEVIKTNKKVEETTTPVEETTTPVEETTTPVEETTTPVEETTTPVEETTTPVEETTTPVEVPEEEKTKKIEETTEPVEETTVSEEEKTEPEELSTTPINEKETSEETEKLVTTGTNEKVMLFTGVILSILGIILFLLGPKKLKNQ